MDQLDNDKPPLFKTWGAWYLLLLGVLTGCIFLFSLFTKTFS